ncbi:Uu.00g089710.m01.CDS01 [Anthostomella pinea]|uniref:Uu.00g089710.m01.CDS01 n=1 Tax=Anthostomella pinea TaxID=933095 RepID=A0AAI8YK71_9PEZI|nr:Uu.00g089710.m01.CDS01 [Anthostomella pinea]
MHHAALMNIVVAALGFGATHVAATPAGHRSNAGGLEARGVKCLACKAGAGFAIKGVYDHFKGERGKRGIGEFAGDTVEFAAIEKLGSEVCHLSVPSETLEEKLKTVFDAHLGGAPCVSDTKRSEPIESDSAVQPTSTASGAPAATSSGAAAGAQASTSTTFYQQLFTQIFSNGQVTTEVQQLVTQYMGSS